MNGLVFLPYYFLINLKRSDLMSVKNIRVNKRIKKGADAYPAPESGRCYPKRNVAYVIY